MTALPPIDPVADDPVARALRGRRWMRRSAVAVVVLFGCASCWSHRVAPSDASALDGKRVSVERVIDGDTIIVKTDAGRERVRLRGVDAPELDPPAYWSDESRRYLQTRIGDRPVVIKFELPQTHDRYGRLLAFVYVGDGECVNLSLVRDGQAYADRRFDSFMRSQLEQAETQARKKQTGLWKSVTDEQQPKWRQEWLARTKARK